LRSGQKAASNSWPNRPGAGSSKQGFMPSSSSQQYKASQQQQQQKAKGKGKRQGGKRCKRGTRATFAFGYSWA